MEFPAGMHHYFDQKVCTFHYWLRYVKPKRGWEDYHEHAKAESATAGYVMTLPSDEVIKAGIAGVTPPAVTVPSVEMAQPVSAPGEVGESSGDQPTGIKP
jgi:hypothetical protein